MQGGSKIPLVETPYQTQSAPLVKMTEEQRLTVQELEEMVRKEAIVQAQNEPKQFLSPIFVAPKKSAGFLPIINLKKLNSCIEYNHFKIEGIFLLNELLVKDDIFAIDLENAHFSVPLHQNF